MKRIPKRGQFKLSLKEQHELIKRLVKDNRKGKWNQGAANKLGNYMISNKIQTLALRGYYAEISQHGLYVRETPVEEYGIGYYLRVTRFKGELPK
jgi:hypothetical protein